MNDPLGPHGLAVVVDLLDAIALGSGGIHLVVTERPHAVRAEIEARCPLGWAVEALLASDRDRLSAAAYEDSEEQSVLLLDVIEPLDEREHPALRALNTDREWLMRRGRCAVVLVAGESAAAADMAYVELQGHAPDFWSVRNRVYRAVGPDPQHKAVGDLVDQLVPHFGGDRGAAGRWLDTRPFQEDWITYRLWRDGPSREAWLAMAVPSSVEPIETRYEMERGILLESRDEAEPLWSTEPIGEAIDPQRWPQPTWPSGHLDPEQHALVSALEVMLDQQGSATLHRLPEEEEASERLDDAIRTLGLLRESRYAQVLHLDARTGLEDAIVRCLHEAGEPVVMPGLVHAARRLAGALGKARVLLLLTSVTHTDLEFLRATMPRREFVASLRSAPHSTFCVVGPSHRQAYTAWATAQLSRWAAGAKRVTIDSKTAVLDLRAALAGAEYVVLLADSSLSVLSPDAWHPVTLASSRSVGFLLGDPPFPTTPAVQWRGELGGDEATALGRLLAVARELAGDPMSVGDPARALWPTTEPITDPFATVVETDQPHQPDALLPDRAKNLNNRGVRQSKLGRREEALASATEAVELYRSLAKERPDAFLPDLAASLNNLGAMHSELGQQEEALASTAEAVELYTELAKERPDAFLPDLAMTLGARGLVCMSAGMHADALDAFSEGLRRLHPAFSKLPDAFRSLMSGLARGAMQASQAANLPILEDLRSLIEELGGEP